MSGKKHVEIERKFLVDTSVWTPGTDYLQIKQGYLSIEPERTVRVRTTQQYLDGSLKASYRYSPAEHGYLTVKGITKGITRTEIEQTISFNKANKMLELCHQPVLEKQRHTLYVRSPLYNTARLDPKGTRYVWHWTIDVFQGELAGLVLAEIELLDENEQFDIPPWLGQEVSHDPAYYNSNLSKGLVVGQSPSP